MTNLIPYNSIFMLDFFGRVLVCCTAFATLSAAADSRPIPLSGNAISGFAVAGSTLYVWGDGAFAIDLRNGHREQLADGRFEEGGCVLDGGLVLNSVAPRQLLWLRLSDRQRFVIDTAVDTRDAIAADLLGHHGVLLIHKRQQVRFYDMPSPMRDHWTESELYTIYTPSTEGGIVIADIDGDGLPDLLCGNYWMKSPTAFDLPWREFAIDTWSEEEGSAMLRLAWSAPVRIAAQRDMRPARASWFERAADPKQLWPSHELMPGGVAGGVSAALFVGRDLILSEREAPGRILLFHRTGAGFAPAKELTRANNVIGIAVFGTHDLLLIQKNRVVLLRHPKFN